MNVNKWSIKATSLTIAIIVCTPVVNASMVQVGFSPEGSAEQLVMNVIGTADNNIRMMAYSFTAPDVVSALIAAKQRGVDVKIVVDEKGNRSKSSIDALSSIKMAGIEVRTNNYYKIQHDKVIIVDDKTVETGSFNYTASAERKNSENAMVISDAPELAAQYLQHWQDRWNKCQEFNGNGKQVNFVESD
jgi:phosphatidylserine/phosphatidylglycerophosphate/cardiolipin synthase-like enzyme